MYRLGVCHLMLHNDTQALQLIEESLRLNPEIDPEHANYWLGMAYKYSHQPEKALVAFENHLALNQGDLHKEELAAIHKIMDEIKVASNHLEFENEAHQVALMEIINSRNAEHNLCYSSDENMMMFTSARPSANYYAGYHFEQIYYATKRPDNTWGRFRKVIFPDNKAEHSGIIQILENNDLLVFKPDHNGNFYIAKRTRSGWGKLQPLKGINSGNIESHAHISANGKRIVFSSDRNNRKGKLDLFESHLQENGKWSKPVALPSYINAEGYDEGFPFLSEDGKTLYFSSNGEGTMGGYDVFQSNWDEMTNSWGTPVHMGAPINSIADDVFYKVDKSGRTATFSSNRQGGKGKTDLYKVEIGANEQPMATNRPHSSEE